MIIADYLTLFKPVRPRELLRVITEDAKDVRHLAVEPRPVPRRKSDELVHRLSRVISNLRQLQCVAKDDWHKDAAALIGGVIELATAATREPPERAREANAMLAKLVPAGVAMNELAPRANATQTLPPDDEVWAVLASVEAGGAGQAFGPAPRRGGRLRPGPLRRAWGREEAWRDRGPAPRASRAGGRGAVHRLSRRVGGCVPAGEISDYYLFPAGKLKRGTVPLERATKQPLSYMAIRSMFVAVERIAGVEHQQGRSFYGLRRQATDLAPEFAQDARVLNRLTGHTDSTTRERVYQDPPQRASTRPRR
jgi:integrase